MARRPSADLARDRRMDQGNVTRLVELPRVHRRHFLWLLTAPVIGGCTTSLFNTSTAPLETVAEALKALRDEMAKAGKSEQFDVLKGSLTGEDDSPRGEIASRLGMSEGAVKVALHRLRRRYGELLRAAVAETVSNEADLNDEMRYLVAVLRKE